MKLSPSTRPRRPSPHRSSGYTLIELTITVSILMAGIAAAATLTLTSSKLEDVNYRKARSIDIVEGAGRLWQLGMADSDVRGLLLGDPGLSSLTINGDAGDPTTVTPTSRGTAISPPSSHIGTMSSARIRSVLPTRPSAGGTDTDTTEALDFDPTTTAVDPMTVIR